MAINHKKRNKQYSNCPKCEIAVKANWVICENCGEMLDDSQDEPNKIGRPKRLKDNLNRVDNLPNIWGLEVKTESHKKKKRVKIMGRWREID